MIYIGRLGSDALAAIAFNMPLFFIILGLTMGLGTGVTASIARFIGAKDKVNADNSAEHTILLAFGISAGLSVIGLVFGRQMLIVLGAENEILELGWSYLKIICIGLSFLVFSAFFRSILSGEGDMKLPMIVSAVGTVLNIILDPIFIFGFKMGVAGAAIATVISQSIVFIIFVYLLFIKEHAYITFRMKDFSFSIKIIVDILKVGLPASLSMLIMSFGQAVFNRILVFYSSDSVAALQIGGRIDMLIFLPIMSIAAALTTIVGMFYGANDLVRLKAIIKYGLQRSILITAIGSVTVFIAAPLIVSAFTNSEIVHSQAVTYLRLITLIYPCVSIGMTCGRVLQGLGLGMPSLIITIVRVLGVSAPLALFFTFVLGKPIEWVWYSMMSSSIFAVIIGLSWLRIAIRRISAVAV
jgi:putative MATE family efflux protein